MKLRIALISAAVSVVSVTSLVSGATASAAPVAHQVGYHASVVGDHIVLTTTAGSLRTSDGQFQVLDAAGRVLTQFPLSYTFDNVSYPIQASASGRTATLTPRIPGRIPVDQPLTRAERDQQALNQLGSTVSTAVSIGALIGTIIGAAAGCVITLAAGCLPGVITGAGLGGIAGTIIAGGPTLIGAVDQYFRTINSPFVPPKK